MRLRPQSELGWLMLQWLAVLVLGHNALNDPSLLRGRAAKPRQAEVRVGGKSIEERAAERPEAPKAAPLECGCCRREVNYLDGTYGTCDACAECLSLGHCYDPAEGDQRYNVQCCHGENHVSALRASPADQTVATAAREAEPTDPLWWLSFSDDAKCLGVAIVAAANELETYFRALHLGIHPGGQMLGLEIPPENRAECAPHQNRLLTVDEAQALFGARSIRELKESGDLTPELLEHLDETGTIRIDTQPPPEPDT
jgi:hypothetical protein